MAILLQRWQTSYQNSHHKILPVQISPVSPRQHLGLVQCQTTHQNSQILIVQQSPVSLRQHLGPVHHLSCHPTSTIPQDAAIPLQTSEALVVLSCTTSSSGLLAVSSCRCSCCVVATTMPAPSMSDCDTRNFLYSRLQRY